MAQRCNGMQGSIEEAVVELVNTRHSMARLIGSPSYAQYRLATGSLAGTPEAVQWYLKEAHKAIFAEGRAEARELQSFAHKRGLLHEDEPLRHWTVTPTLKAVVQLKTLPGLTLGQILTSFAVTNDVAIRHVTAAAKSLLGVRLESAAIGSETCALVSCNVSISCAHKQFLAALLCVVI
jgi:hypothetical protein